MSFLSSLGLTLESLDTFGFGTANTAVSIFGDTAVREFISAETGIDAATNTMFSTDELFSFAQRYDDFFAGQNIDSDALNQLLAVDAQLQAEGGFSLEDVNVTIDADGNITGSVEGVAGATNTLNFNDLLDQALAEAGLDGVFDNVGG